MGASSNRPRNEAFTYFLAGELLRAGLHVRNVDGIAMSGVSNVTKADVELELQNQRIAIECKRPLTAQSLTKRADEAYSQLLRSSQNLFGIATIDSSAFIRRSHALVEAGLAEEADSFITRAIEAEILPKVPKPRSMRILGIGLFARVPVMVRKEHSAVLASSGEYYTTFVPYSVSSWLVSNSPSRDQHLLKSIARALQRDSKTK